ncbi:MAG: rhodanese-like domain-containing protein [Robiginitalea sp.]
MKQLRYFLILTLLIWACEEAREMPITEFSTSELREEDLLVDVRTLSEFKEGHLDGAVNIDWMSWDFIQKWDTIDKDRKVYVYCKKGGRSAAAARVLDSLGYSVVDLTGGWDAYLQQE